MIDNLTQTGVSILTSTDGQNHRKSYDNSAMGRAELPGECPPEIVAEVMAVWGDAPTVEDTMQIPLAPPPIPTVEDRLAALEAVQLEQILGGAI